MHHLSVLRAEIFPGLSRSAVAALVKDATISDSDLANIENEADTTKFPVATLEALARLFTRQASIGYTRLYLYTDFVNVGAKAS